jgi:uncharacterized protein YukJ
MSLPAYGLLIGKIVGSRPQQQGHPHWLLMVQPSAVGHLPYRVAVNLQSTEPGSPPEVQYQVVDIDKNGSAKLKALAKSLRAKGQSNSFMTGPGTPALDFVRGGLVDPKAFQTVAKGDPLRSAFEQALKQAAQADAADEALVAVFGTGYPVNAASGRAPSTGYTGVDNIHMNQGAPNRTGAVAHYHENGPNQDGGLIFLLPSGATGIFVKFQSQSVNTDQDGNPVDTGHPALDAKLPAVRELVTANAAVKTALKTAKAAAPAPTAAAAAAKGFVFADPGPDDITAQFLVDDDHGAFKTPFVMAYGKGTTRGPVPTPRVYPPILNLTDVTGPNPPGVSKAQDGSQSIAFDLIGDSGAPTEPKLPGETTVGEKMAADAGQDKPAFLYHVGDVVYYYGEKEFYYGQFANIFKDYPAPIFAIPGNHDGVIHDPSMVSLESFQQAFCATAPDRWDGFGGILRSTMIQPGVFFTLEAPLISIVGLYSNCGESLGYLDAPQLTFLHDELTRLKADRNAGNRAVVLAVHHLPRWFPGQNDPMSAALDTVCKDVGFWPDAVVVGHAHLYQRIVRTVPQWGDIPYFVNGAGGYGIDQRMTEGKTFIQGLGTDRSKVVLAEGYMRATVTKNAGGALSLAFEYRPATPGVDGDSFKLALAQR